MCVPSVSTSHRLPELLTLSVMFLWKVLYDEHFCKARANRKGRMWFYRGTSPWEAEVGVSFGPEFKTSLDHTESSKL